MTGDRCSTISSILAVAVVIGIAPTSASEIASTSPRFQAALDAVSGDTADAMGAAASDLAPLPEEPTRIRIKYRDGTLATTRRAITDDVTGLLGQTFEAEVETVLAIGEDTETIVLDRALGAADLERAVDNILERDDVEWAVSEKIETAQVVSDPLYHQQWHYHQSGVGIHVQQAWPQATGADVVVAVLDTGILAHEDIADRLLPGYDFVSDLFRANDGDGRDPDPSDPGDWCPLDAVPISSWHGLHVAGTVAAVTDNGVGVAGTARNARILPVRVLGRCGGSSFDITDAIRWAAGVSVPGVPDNPYPAQVINLSLGGSGPCDADYTDAIAQARERGATVVVAAGNSGVDSADFRPANCEGVITVAATNRNGALASFGAPRFELRRRSPHCSPGRRNLLDPGERRAVDAELGHPRAGGG